MLIQISTQIYLIYLTGVTKKTSVRHASLKSLLSTTFKLPLSSLISVVSTQKSILFKIKNLRKTLTTYYRYKNATFSKKKLNKTEDFNGCNVISYHFGASQPRKERIRDKFFDTNIMLPLIFFVFKEFVHFCMI